MKKYIYTLIIAFFTLSNSGYAAPSQDKYLELSEIEWIEQAISILVEDNDIPALSVGIVKDGKVVKYISRGVLIRDSKKQIDENSLFQIGSLTKSFTGIIANHLINEGKLDANASIIKYLPRTLSPQTKLKLEPIRVRDILHHRSGLPRDSKIVRRFGNDPMVCCYTEKDLLDDLELLELEFKPDAKASYSNLGFGLLGYIFERASGKTYEELLQMYVSQKLGLSNTTTEPTDSQKNFRAIPYRKENHRVETKPFEMGKLVSAGGIYSTISDLSKLLTKQLAAERKFKRDNKVNPFVLTEHIKPFWQHLSYGYGIFVTNEGSYGHGGDVDGYASGYSFYPKENIGVIFLTSSGGGWVGQLENVIVKQLRNKPVQMPTLRKTISQPIDQLTKYTGTYKMADDLVINIVQKGNTLEAYPQGHFGPIKLYFETENKLFSKTYPYYFEFEFDENGYVYKTTYFFNDQKLDAIKID